MDTTKSLHEKIFNEDGTIRGITYCRASGHRGATLNLNTNKRLPNKIATMIIVDGVNFSDAYQRAIDVFIKGYGIQEDDSIIDEMRNTEALFLNVRGLMLKPVVVTYYQVQEK